LIALGMAAAMSGQYLLSYQREGWQMGVGLYAIAALLLASGALVYRRGLAPVVNSFRRLRRAALAAAWRPPALALSLALIGVSSHLAHRLQSYYSVLLWVLAVLIGAAAMWGSGGRPRSNRTELVVVSTLVGLGFLLRVFGLASFPDPMSGDEGTFALEALRVLEGRWVDPFGTGWFAHPNLFFYMLAAALRLLGWNLFALRITSVLLGSLGVAYVVLRSIGKFLFSAPPP